MSFVVKTSLGILVLLILVHANVGEKSNINFNEQCQVNTKMIENKICILLFFI
jgi:hypothetical protein